MERIRSPAAAELQQYRMQNEGKGALLVQVPALSPSPGLGLCSEACGEVC